MERLLELWGRVAPGIIGAALVAFFGWHTIQSWRDDRTFGDAPLPCDGAGAVAAGEEHRQWVTVEGAAWRCELMPAGVKGGVAFIPAYVEGGALIVARFDHTIQCRAEVARPLTGIIEPMDAERAKDLRASGLRLPDDPRLLRTLSVCTSCGRDNARWGLVVCPPFVLLGLTLYPLRRWVRAKWGRAHGALQGAIHAPPREASAANRTVRFWGATTLALCAIGAPFMGGWVVYGFIPVRAVCVVGAVISLWMLVSPDSYRRFSARAKR